MIYSSYFHTRKNILFIKELCVLIFYPFAATFNVVERPQGSRVNEKNGAVLESRHVVETCSCAAEPI